jgi:hypothetical protein
LEQFQEIDRPAVDADTVDMVMNSTNYLDILEFSAVTQMAHLQPNVFFQHGGALPHGVLTVRETLCIKHFQTDRLDGKDQSLAPPPPVPQI